MTSFHASRVLTIDTILKNGPGKMLSRPCSLGIPINTYRSMKDCIGLSLNKNIGKIVEVSPHLQSHSPTFIHLFSLGEMKRLWILSVYVKNHHLETWKYFPLHILRELGLGLFV